MPSIFLSSFVVFAGLFLLSAQSHALTPPTGQETLCTVVGAVTELTQADVLDQSMKNTIQVPVIVLHVEDIHAIDSGYAGYFCKMPENRIGAYRLCDADSKSIKSGDRITGTMGRSLGGGPYCIEQVKALE